MIKQEETLESAIKILEGVKARVHIKIPDSNDKRIINTELQTIYIFLIKFNKELKEQHEMNKHIERD